MCTVGFEHENATFSSSSIHSNVTAADAMFVDVSAVRPPLVSGADGLALLAAAAAQIDVSPAPAPSASAMLVSTAATTSVITAGLHAAVPSVYGQSLPAYSTSVHYSAPTQPTLTASATYSTLAVPAMSAPEFTSMSRSVPAPVFPLHTTPTVSTVHARPGQSVPMPGFFLPSSAPVQSYTQSTVVPVQSVVSQSMSVFTSDQSARAEPTTLTSTQVTQTQSVPATALPSRSWSASTPAPPAVFTANQPPKASAAMPAVNTNVSAANVSSNVERSVVSTTAKLDGNSNVTAMSADDKNKLFLSSQTNSGAALQQNETFSEKKFHLFQYRLTQ